MRRASAPLARPVVVFNGYHGWGGLASTVRDGLRKATGSSDIIFVSYAHRCSLRAAAEDARQSIARHLGQDFVSGQQAFDCVGISMGGIVARALATRGANADDERVLRTARAGEPLLVSNIYTLASPHRGAVLATRVMVDQASRDLHPRSPVIAALHRALRAGLSPRLRCFAQTRDAVVGARNCAPASVPNERMPGPVFGSHFSSARNPVFWAAIARELRQETSA